MLNELLAISIFKVNTINLRTGLKICFYRRRMHQQVKCALIHINAFTLNSSRKKRKSRMYFLEKKEITRNVEPDRFLYQHQKEKT